jgi:hypothetical protein
MLDIDMLRPDKGGDPEKFREIQRRRFKDVTLIDRILEADAAWRHQVNTVDGLNGEYNKASKEIGEKMKAKDVAGAEPLKAAQLERGKAIEEAKKQLQELDETRDRRVDPLQRNRFFVAAAKIIFRSESSTTSSFTRPQTLEERGQLCPRQRPRARQRGFQQD